MENLSLFYKSNRLEKIINHSPLASSNILHGFAGKRIESVAYNYFFHIL